MPPAGEANGVLDQTSLHAVKADQRVEDSPIDSGGIHARLIAFSGCVP
ncbi:hypothetical protein ACLMAJ_25890 [Nocardia sp. KC 131]